MLRDVFTIQLSGAELPRQETFWSVRRRWISWDNAPCNCWRRWKSPATWWMSHLSLGSRLMSQGQRKSFGWSHLTNMFFLGAWNQHQQLTFLASTLRSQRLWAHDVVPTSKLDHFVGSGSCIDLEQRGFYTNEQQGVHGSPHYFVEIPIGSSLWATQICAALGSRNFSTWADRATGVLLMGWGCSMPNRTVIASP